LSVRSPDYSCLSKRLSFLGIKSPRYKKNKVPYEKIVAIAIDSTRLKCFGKDEWQQEKYKVSARRSWRKSHIAVDYNHIIHVGLFTDRFESDDKNHVYETLSDNFTDVEIIIPPNCNAVYHQGNHSERNRNFQEIKTFGRMNWQKVRNYGKRNYSELAIQRYKKILGNKLHSKELSRQKNEAILGCGVLK
jgi:hypothetical protein